MHQEYNRLDDVLILRRLRTSLLEDTLLLACRIVTDRETGKQKGFAFIEYYEPQTAQSAVRNLDQADLTGRKLKVTFAQKDMDSVDRQRRGVGMHACMRAVLCCRVAMRVKRPNVS